MPQFRTTHLHKMFGFQRFQYHLPIEGPATAETDYVLTEDSQTGYVYLDPLPEN